MEDTTKEQAEQTHSAETPTPEDKTDRDELKEASQQFFRTLIRAGVHLATTSVNMLPEESREYFVSAGREFTRGLATFANELADNVDTIVDEVKEDTEKDE
ncbi:MAG: hypothetical protein ACXWPS_14020 [Ktedonobacteraceae bacterium]